MDLVTKYRNETNKDAFTESYYLDLPDGNYKNDYVVWLEGLLNDQQRELLIAYELHMLRQTEQKHRKYWAERTVDRYLITK